MFKRFSFALTLLTLTSLVSCGDLFTKKKATVQFGVTADCELDAAAISNYFVEDIGPDIKCLGAYLEDFVKVVKTNKPGHLQLDALIDFIKANLDDFDSNLLGPIKGIFEMNSLLYGDHPQYIARKNLTSLIKVFVDVNRIIVEKKIYQHFINKDENTYEKHSLRKSDVYYAFNYVANRLRDEYKPNENSLDFKTFLDNFRHLDDSNIIENSEKLLFIKKIILGGDKEHLAASELKGIIERLVDIGKVVFDLTQFQYVEKDEVEEENMVETLTADAKSILETLYYSAESAEPLFSIEEVFDAVGVFYPEVLKYQKYEDELLEVKDILFGNNSPIFTGQDVYFLIKSIALENLERGRFFYRVYRLNKDTLDAGGQIKNDFYPFTFSDKEKEDLKIFNRIVQNYAYYKGYNGTIKFKLNVNRSAFTIFFISAVEDLIKRVYLARGVTNKELDSSFGKSKFLHEKVMEQNDLLNLFKKFERLLVDEGFIHPGRIENTNETITLMATLFQHQSNGDAFVEVNELTEFILDLLSSTEVSKDINDKMIALCRADENCSLDDKDRYLPSFYRENINELFEVNTAKGKVKDYFPGLYDYLNAETDEDVQKFFKTTERFARSCTHFDDGTPVPMNDSDFFSMFTGLMAIEQTIQKFDKAGKNGQGAPDGILQPNEVMDAYPIYEDAIKAIIPVRFLKRFSKSFYLYLIKYERVPDVQGIKSLKDFGRALKAGGHFLGFLFKSKRKKQAPADRFTIAKILEVLADFSPAAEENPFPCEDLR